MTRVPRLRENREYRGTGERVVFHRVTGRVAATQKAEQKWPTKRRSRRQIFRAVDDNGLIKSAAPSREDLPRSSDVATTPTPISLLPFNKTNWLTSLSFLRPVSFAKRRLDELVPEPTDNEFARNEFAQEIRGEGERGCPPPINRRRYRTRYRRIRSRHESVYRYF